MPRLAIVVTHPIQYYVPIFRELAQYDDLEVQVFHTKSFEATRFDHGFGQVVEWDLDLTSGYAHVEMDCSKWIGRVRLLRQLRKFAPKAMLVIGWNPKGHLLAMWFGQFFSRIWFRGDSHFLDPMPQWKTALRTSFLRLIYRPVSHAFYVGDANLEYYRRCGLKESQLTHAPHAIDQAAFLNVLADQSRAELRALFGFEAGQFVVGFAGKLEHKKDPLGLIEAFQMVQLEDAILAIAGSGDLESQVQASAKEDARMRLLGFINQSQMAAFLFSCDVLVLPSTHNETWGLVVNEALAVGTPVIVSSALGCASDVKRRGPDCVDVVPPRNPLELGRALIQAKTRCELHARETIEAWCKEANSYFQITAIASAIHEAMQK